MPLALRNFIIGYLLLHFLATLLMAGRLTSSVEEIMIDSAKQQLNAKALIMREHVQELKDGIHDQSLIEYLSDLGDETEFRFTLIDADGTTIADSKTGDQETGPHANRPEIISATASDHGFAQRFSDSLRVPMIYVAVMTQPEQADSGGYIRVAMPSLKINSAIRSAQNYFWIFAVSLSVLTALLMTVFASFMMKPLGLFAEAARKIGVGQYESFPSLLNRNDEWRSLATAFRSMQSEMANREQRIVKNRDRLQAVLSSMIEGVVSVSPDRNVLIANRAACRMLEVDEAEFRGRNLLEVVRDPELAGAIEKTQAERTFSRTEFQINREFDRRTISARVSVLPEPGHDDQDVPGLVVVLNDITELRQLENMRRDFVANVSHELKTPLASIRAYAETLKLGAINDQEKNIKFVEQIEQQADFLNQQIQDLLQIARIESGNEMWDIEPVDLNEQCTEAVSRFSKLAEANKVSLELNLDDEGPKARADVEGLVTILSNLITNAVSYTPEGGQVTVTTFYSNNSAVVEVADTGIGIAPEHQRRIFERFYRVDKARSRDKGGTGLGLSIVKHLAQSFGGSVELESQIGEGTKFRIRLPKYVG